MQNAEVQNRIDGFTAATGEEFPSVVQEDGGNWRVRTNDAGPDLRARTTHYARRIIRLYLSLAKDTLAQVLGKQLLRSGTSVGANYRECCRGRSKAEFIAKLGDCLRELDESAY